MKPEIKHNTDIIFTTLLDELGKGQKLDETAKLINETPLKTFDNYEDVGAILALFASIKESELSKQLINRVKVPKDALNCLNIFQGVINYRETDDDGKSVIEIVQHLVDSGFRVDGVHDHGKDAIQTAAQQRHEVDGKIVKILLKTRQAPKLEDELSDFALFLLESGRIRHFELEKKEFFCNEELMPKFLESYKNESNPSTEHLEELAEKIWQNYGVMYHKKSDLPDQEITVSAPYKMFLANEEKTVKLTETTKPQPSKLDSRKVVIVTNEETAREDSSLLKLAIKEENNKTKPSTELDAKSHTKIKSKSKKQNNCIIS